MDERSSSRWLCSCPQSHIGSRHVAAICGGQSHRTVSCQCGWLTHRHTETPFVWLPVWVRSWLACAYLEKTRQLFGGPDVGAVTGDPAGLLFFMLYKEVRQNLAKRNTKLRIRILYQEKCYVYVSALKGLFVTKYDNLYEKQCTYNGRLALVRLTNNGGLILCRLSRARGEWHRYWAKELQPAYSRLPSREIRISVKEIAAYLEPCSWNSYKRATHT
jgi:hypothetical protein